VSDQDITVTGKRQSDNTVWYVRDGQYHSWVFDPTTETWSEGATYSERPTDYVEDDPTIASDSVTIKLTNNANMQEALKAAGNILSGLNKLRADLKAVAPDKSVTFSGKVMTRDEALNLLNKTTFTVTDVMPSNGGTGSAEYDASGNHRVSFHFESYDGDGIGDYAHPNYENQEGVVGIILHELGHLTQAGYEFNKLSFSLFSRENAELKTPDRQFHESEYYPNQEARANDFARAVAYSFGVDIDTWVDDPTHGLVWQSPHDIYNENISELEAPIEPNPDVASASEDPPAYASSENYSKSSELTLLDYGVLA
jgi:hypothetical protein